jgi:hypothetical protein
MTKYGKLVTIAALFLCAPVFADDKDGTRDEKPAMELGGYVTVDYETPLDDFLRPSLKIGEVDLGANVNISSAIVASVLIKTWDRLDSLWIDQALVSYYAPQQPFEFLFGQQTMNHGLLTTRLISDPSILDNVELKKPSLIVNGHGRTISGGLGMAVISRDRGYYLDPEQLYAWVVNVDQSLPNESMVRLSSLACSDQIDLDIAGLINVRKFTIDIEGLMTFKAPADTLKTAGFYAGVRWNATEQFGVALRTDGLSRDNFRNTAMRYAGGADFRMKDGIFFAVEISREVPVAGQGEPFGALAFEVGLERKIQLPGFQRKTLTRE